MYMEKVNKFYVVYKTTNLKNGKFYIGVHETFNLDDGYLGSGKVLKNSVYYHGKENFKKEILHFCEDRDSMFQKEKEIVTEELINETKCMNLCVGGLGGSGGIQSEEHHKKMLEGSAKYNKEKWKDPVYRKHISDVQREQMKERHRNGVYSRYDSFRGKTHTEESKEKISKSLKGNGVGDKNSQFGTMWITNGQLNKKIKKSETIPLGWSKGRK